MGRIKSLVVAFTLVVGLVGCGGLAALAALAKQAGSSALAAPARQKDTRLARLYFLREKGIFGAMGGLAASSEIKIDGKPVGKLEMGSYFVVDRPPGVHTIASHTTMAMADYDIEVQLDAGKTYYFGVGTQRGGPPVQDLLNQAVAGSSGQQIRSSSPFKSAFAGAGLFRLEPAAGAAAIEKLKAP